jgi:hypothetical protein
MNNYADFYGLEGDNFNIEAVCPNYLPESQCTFTWYRDHRGIAIISGYDPEEDESNHWLCHCGHFITNGCCHCFYCGGESPWGCDCGARDEDYDVEIDFGFEFDPYELFSDGEES